MKENFKKLKEASDKKYKELDKIIRIISICRLICFITIVVFLCLISLNSAYKVLYIVLFILSIITFIYLILIHDKYYKKQEYYEKFLYVIERYIKRENNDWKEFLYNGDKYLNKKNIYLKDLDIVGKNSLYQYLCCAVTSGGREKLFKYLDNIKLSGKDIKNNQEILEEFSKNKDFVYNFEVYLSYLMDNVELDSHVNIFKNKIKNQGFLLLTIIGNVISLLAFIISACMGNFTLFCGVAVIKYSFSYLYGMIYKKNFDDIALVSSTSNKIYNILNYASSYNFDNKKLIEIQNNFRNSMELIKKLDTINTFSKLKENFVANFIFNGIVTIDPYILYRYYKIQNLKVLEYEKSIKYIEEFEVLVSLAVIPLTHENVCIPEVVEDKNLEFEGLIHPLLEEKKCVPNDFNNKMEINIITGSNMSGKTSFMRTIGINIILANCGSYVCAKSLKTSYFKVFTSLRVEDDIEEGISTFYGELLRVKDAIEYRKREENMLVFIDEIFKGTNFNDRMIGAKAVIEKLRGEHTIAFISTHDFELCNTENIDNYYFSEHYKENKILFDYKIKKGRCTTTNAKYLMKRLNIIDE